MAKDGSIRLSDQHGVNPSLMVCALCGQSTGVALLGKLPNDAEAPYSIPDQMPCDECKKHMEQGIVLVEARQRDDGFALLGGYWVVSEEAIKRIFTDDMVPGVLRTRAAYIEPDLVDALGLRDIPMTEGE